MMDIHHELIIHNTPERVYEALTNVDDLAVWWGAQVVGQTQVGEVIEIQFQQRTMKLEIIGLEPGRRVQWRVIEPMWPMEGIDQVQVMTWIIDPYEDHAMVTFCMEGWPSDDGVYASVSYRSASYIFRLKVYMGDTRDIEGLMVRQS